MAKILPDFSPKNKKEEAILEAWERLGGEGDISFEVFLRLNEYDISAEEILEIADGILVMDFDRISNPVGIFISRVKKHLGIERLE